MKRSKTIKIGILHSIREAYHACLNLAEIDWYEGVAAKIPACEERIKYELQEQKANPEVSYSIASAYVEACQQHLLSLPNLDATKVKNFTDTATPFFNLQPISVNPKPAVTLPDTRAKVRKEAKYESNPQEPVKTTLGLTNFSLSQDLVNRGEAVRTKFTAAPRVHTEKLRSYGFFAESKNTAAKLTYELLTKGYRPLDAKDSKSDYELAQKLQDEEIGRFFR